MKRDKYKSVLWLLVGAFFLISLADLASAKDYSPADLVIPETFKAEIEAKDFNNPRMIDFDNQERIIVAESGSGDFKNGKVTRIEANGDHTTLVDAADLGEQLPINAVAYYDNKVFISHGGAISVLEQDGKVLREIVSDLPGPVNQIVFRGSVMYFTVANITGAGLAADKSLGDVPCKDLKVNGLKDPVKGKLKCNGVLMRSELDGRNLQMVAWGLNPDYGLVIGPDQRFYLVNKAYENTELRQVGETPTCLIAIEEGRWYGWPDYKCDGSPIEKPLLKEQPSKDIPKPAAKITGKPNGFAFAPSNDWGKTTDLFVAEDNKVVRVDSNTGEQADFVSTVENGRGLIAAKEIVFGPNGSMFITDGDGSIWKISKSNGRAVDFHDAFGFSVFFSILQLIVLSFLLVMFAVEKDVPSRNLVNGFRNGAKAGTAAILVSIILGFIYKAKWFGMIQLFSIFSTGDVRNFDLKLFISGLLVFVIFMAIFGLLFARILRTVKIWRVFASALIYSFIVWGLLQYLILPHYSPIIVERVFPLSAFFFVFLVYGISLAVLYEGKQIWEQML